MRLIDKHKTIKIIGFYAIGLICLASFFYIDKSENLRLFLRKADEFKTNWGFGFYAVIGFIKFSLLVTGITTPIILTFMLVKEQIKKNAL